MNPIAFDNHEVVAVDFDDLEECIQTKKLEWKYLVAMTTKPAHFGKDACIVAVFGWDNPPPLYYAPESLVET